MSILDSPYGFGAIPDPRDDRDYGYHLAAMAFTDRGPSWPTRQDNRWLCSAVRNQMQVPACVGFAGTGLMEMGTPQNPAVGMTLSAIAGYKWAQRFDGILGDSYPGTTPRGIAKALKSWGVPPEEFWPFFPDDIGMPLPQARAAALPHRIGRYERLSSPGQIKHAIAAFGGILAVFDVHEGWRDPGAVEDYIIMPQDGEGYYHAVMLVGYDDDDAFYIIKNSWGEEWAHDGFAKIPYRDPNLKDTWLLVR